MERSNYSSVGAARDAQRGDAASERNNSGPAWSYAAHSIRKRSSSVAGCRGQPASPVGPRLARKIRPFRSRMTMFSFAATLRRDAGPRQVGLASYSETPAGTRSMPTVEVRLRGRDERGRGRGTKSKQKGRKKGCNTRTSQGVTHPSTTLAQARLTSEF